ncbi:hypothetical protein CAPTEDRAFT_125715, partial [Capitella teleta]
MLTNGSNGGQPTWCPAKCQCSDKDLSVTCKNVKLEGIPSDLPPFIHSLDLTNNRIPEISNGTFIVYQNLTKLILTDNNITKIEEDAFYGLVNLAELSLKRNCLSIEDIPKFIFQNITTLTKLHLSDTLLRAIPGDAFYGLENLSELFL